jgi:hypothetical protein
MITEFSEKFKWSFTLPMSTTLFKVHSSSRKLEKEKQCHTFAIKPMFLGKCVGQDILPEIAFVATKSEN